jgi:hypothetical protein
MEARFIFQKRQERHFPGKYCAVHMFIIHKLYKLGLCTVQGFLVFYKCLHAVMYLYFLMLTHPCSILDYDDSESLYLAVPGQINPLHGQVS